MHFLPEVHRSANGTVVLVNPYDGREGQDAPYRKAQHPNHWTSEARRRRNPATSGRRYRKFSRRTAAQFSAAVRTMALHSHDASRTKSAFVRTDVRLTIDRKDAPALFAFGFHRQMHGFVSRLLSYIRGLQSRLISGVITSRNQTVCPRDQCINTRHRLVRTMAGFSTAQAKHRVGVLPEHLYRKTSAALQTIAYGSY
jgi:hypothetical protein